MEGYYLTKNISTDVIKDVDVVKGIVTGYFSIFNNKDSDGDIILPGAYKRTLKANGPESDHPRILHLYMHDAYRPLGKPSVLKEDKTGLYFETHISQTQLGKDVIQLYQDKVLTEHSIGYQIVKREVDEASETQKLMELKLWEGSTVSWGANEQALVSSVKSEGMPRKQRLDMLVERMKVFDSAMKNNYSDETARQLEIEYKQLQQIILSLVSEEPEMSTLPDNSKTITAAWIIDKLNIKI